MYKEQTVGPAVDPVTLADIKLYNFVKSDSRDSEITQFLPTAIKKVEDYTGRALIDQEFDIWYDAEEFKQMMGNNFAYLSTLNVTSIESISSFSIDGTETIIDDTTYRLQNNQAKFDVTIPSGSTRAQDAYKISVRAGYGADDTEVPATLKTAIAYMIKHYLSFKGNVSTEPTNHIPNMVKEFMTPYTSTMKWFN